MEYTTIILFLVIATVCYLLYHLRETITYGYVSSFLVLVLGVVILVQGLDVPTGTTETHNLTAEETGANTTTTGTIEKTTQYATVEPMYSRLLGLSMLFIGLHLLFNLQVKG